MKIKLLKYHQIDFKKYDHCIQNSPFSRVEAFSWYLDITTHKKWKAFVYGDYDLVMPIFLKRTRQNIFVKKIVQPMFSQQLGVFSKNQLTIPILNKFVKKLSEFKVICSQFNIGCKFENQLHIKSKTNYELDLNNTYEQIIKNYGKGLKSNLKKAIKQPLEVRNDISVKQFLSFKEKNAKHVFSSKNKNILENLLIQLNQKALGHVYSVFNKDKLVSSCYIINHNNRLVYLSSTTNEEGKKIGANSFILDKIIEKHANTNTILDFEGSTVKGIAHFFKSFGSVDNPYFAYSNQ